MSSEVVRIAYSVLDIVSQKQISYDLGTTSSVFAQSEEDLWRFQVEAQEAYVCKQILGLCHNVHKHRNLSKF